MTNGKVMGCHMPHQESDTWHGKNGSQLAMCGKWIPWLTLSHVSGDVIKKKL